MNKKKSELLELGEKGILKINNTNYTVSSFKRYKYKERAGLVIKYVLENTRGDIKCLIVDEYMRKNIFGDEIKKEIGEQLKNMECTCQRKLLGWSDRDKTFSALEADYSIYELKNSETLCIFEGIESHCCIETYVDDRDIVIGRKTIGIRKKVILGKKNKQMLYDKFYKNYEITHYVYVENRLYSLEYLEKLRDENGAFKGEEYLLKDRETDEIKRLRVIRGKREYEIYVEDREECLRAFLNFEYTLFDFIWEKIGESDERKVYTDKYQLNPKNKKVVLLKKDEREYIEKNKRELVMVREFKDEKRYYYGYYVKQEDIGLVEKEEVTKYQAEEGMKIEKELREKNSLEKIEEKERSITEPAEDSDKVSDGEVVLSMATIGIILYFIGRIYFFL